MTSLVKTIDKQIEEASPVRTGTRKHGIYVIFCSDDSSLKTKLQDWLAKEKLQHVVICMESAAGPTRYRLAKEADTTAVIYVNSNRVMANFPLRKGELTEEKAKEITQELARVLPRK